MELAGISLREADGQVFLHVVPVEARAPLDSLTLLAWLVEQGCGDCQLHSEAIDQAALDCNAQQKAFVLLVAQRCDAAVQVQIAPDDMSASLSIAKAKGGKSATTEAVLQVLAGAGVTSGINQDAVANARQQLGCNGVVVAS